MKRFIRKGPGGRAKLLMPSSLLAVPNTSGLTNQGPKLLSKGELEKVAPYGRGITTYGGALSQYGGTQTGGVSPNIWEGYNLGGAFRHFYGRMGPRQVRRILGGKLTAKQFFQGLWDKVLKPVSGLIPTVIKAVTGGAYEDVLNPGNAYAGMKNGKATYTADPQGWKNERQVGLSSPAGTPMASMEQSKALKEMAKKQASGQLVGNNGLAPRAVLDTHALNVLDSIIIGAQPFAKVKPKKGKKKGKKGSGIAYL